MEKTPFVAQWREARPWLNDTVICDTTLPWAKPAIPCGAVMADILGEFHKAGIDHISVTVAAGSDGAVEALSALGELRADIAHASDRLIMADTIDAMRSARRAGLLSVSLHLQTATPFLSDLNLVEPLRALGIGRALLVFNERNLVGDGCHEPADAGLSAFGRRLIAQMNKCRMIVDVSHCGVRTSLEAIDCSERPVIFSHSNARTLFDHERNISDEQIRACAGRQGFIGVNSCGMFLGAKGPDIARVMSEHIAHIAALAGPESVGLGIDYMYLKNSDYAFFHQRRHRWPRGYDAPPWSFLEPEHVPFLVVALEARGFNQIEMKGILGENYMRTLEKWN